MKILFFDIDGTLSDEATGIIPDSCKEAIKQAQAQGHLCFVNTGRPFSTIPSQVMKLGLDGYVCGCGCYIQYKDQVLLESNLSIDLCKEIVTKLQETKMSGVLEGSRGVYYEPDNKNATIENIKAVYTQSGFDMTKTWFDEDICFDKATCWINEDSDFEAFHHYMTQHFEGIKRAEDFYEYIQKEYSKATGIQYLLDYFKLPLQDAYVFGDSTNDLSMLLYVKNSTAMGNGCQEVKDVVSYITDSVENDGIMNALKYWGIIQ